MLNTYRRHDAVLIICQKNEAMRIEVAAVNDQARQITGYVAEQMVGKDLLDYLDDDLRAHIEEHVNYQDPQQDLGEALFRIRNLKLRAPSGELQEFRLRVVRSELMDNDPTFHLVLEDERVALETDKFKEVLKENFRGHEVLEEETGLPNRTSLLKDLELFQFFAKKREVTACFATLQLDNAAKLSAMMGAQVPLQVLKHLGQLCEQRLRREDQVGLLSDQALGLILMQITPQSARVVLNRLRWSASSMPVILETGNRVDPEISIAFTMIDETAPDELVKRCEIKLASPGEEGALFEV